MTETFDCQQMEELAAELALGIVSGAERASALEHLASCSSCRSHVEELAEVADELLLIGPEREPPLGFEVRVLDAMALPQRAEVTPMSRLARLPRRRLLAVAAALLVVLGGVGGAGAALGRKTAPGLSPLTKQYIAALNTMGGSALAAEKLHTSTGTADAGEVFAYEGRPSWLFVSVWDSAAPSGLTVQLVMNGGRSVTAGHLQAAGQRQSLGTTLDIDVTAVQAVQLLDATGAVRYKASFALAWPGWSAHERG